MARSRTRARLPTPDEIEDAEDHAETERTSRRRETRVERREPRTVSDLAPKRSERRRERMATGTAVNLDIAPAFDPGFLDTEFINRTAFMYGFQFVWDPAKGHWRPLMTTDLISSATTQGLLADTITEALGNVLGSQDGISPDPNGDLVLDDVAGAGPDLTGGTRTEGTTTEAAGLRILPANAVDSVRGEIAQTATQPTRVRVFDWGSRNYLVTQNFAGNTFDVPVSLQKGGEYSILVDAAGASWTYAQWETNVEGIETPAGTVFRSELGASSNPSPLYEITRIGAPQVNNEGTATTSFATPERVTRYQRALYDPTSNGGNVRVDLYSGDPASPSSELLARDIDPREPIQDIPPSKGPLQYKYTMERAPDGSSPRVSMSGIQYER